jgi:predicted membrane metal-binding protein
MALSFPYRIGIAPHALGIPNFLMSFAPVAGVISLEKIQRRRLL